MKKEQKFVVVFFLKKFIVFFSNCCRPLLICHIVVYVMVGEKITSFADFYAYDFVTSFEVLNK